MSKWHLVLGAYDAEAYVFAAVMVGAGLLTAGYLFPIAHRAFFRSPPSSAPAHDVVQPDLVPVVDGGHDGPTEHQVSAEPAPDGAALVEHAPVTRSARDASPLMVVPLCLTALLALLLGLGDQLGVIELARQVAGAVTGAGP